jgi:uncharacterized lipoprotein YehR (DUF1307 family)
MILSKFFNDLDEAEKFLNNLYEKYNSVECVNEPLFYEHGIYTFRVE